MYLLPHVCIKNIFDLPDAWKKIGFSTDRHFKDKKKIFFIHTWGKRYMHTRPKKIIVCLGLPVTLWKRLGKGDQDFFVFVASMDNTSALKKYCLFRLTRPYLKFSAYNPSYFISFSQHAQSWNICMPNISIDAKKKS
jgi:hypothetical protein